MSTYAIGDLQGCFLSLKALLKRIGFDTTQDQLWLVGDLVNRGPGSLECLRYISRLGEHATVVLGNHDLHLLAVAEGVSKQGKRDTIQQILDAPDRDALLDWLRHQKLVHLDGNYLMVHAGLLLQWDLNRTMELAGEIESLIRGPNRPDFVIDLVAHPPNPPAANPLTPRS